MSLVSRFYTSAELKNIEMYINAMNGYGPIVMFDPEYTNNLSHILEKGDICDYVKYIEDLRRMYNATPSDILNAYNIIMNQNKTIRYIGEMVNLLCKIHNANGNYPLALEIAILARVKELDSIDHGKMQAIMNRRYGSNEKMISAKKTNKFNAFH